MQKYSAKLILNTKKHNKKGQSPIWIRVIINRKTSYKATGYHIDAKFWDEKKEQVKSSYRDHSIINADITSKKTEVMQMLVHTQIKGEVISVQQVKSQMEHGNQENIFLFSDRFIDEVRHKRKPGTLENYRKHLKKLEDFHGSRNLRFEEITTDYLSKYENSLRDSEVGGNYVHALFKTIRTFFNAAIKRGVTQYYPFNVYENPVYEAPQKDYLSLKELKDWEKYADKVTNHVMKQTAVYFLLGCYSGLRISDWKQFEISKHLVEERIYLRATKNNEWVTMPLSTPLKRTLDRIREMPLDIEEPTLNEKLKDIAKELKIRKHITSHTGRHTFAITMCAERGISSETCAELMGITVKTCVENYYKVTNRKIDKETNEAWKGL
ncbi:site-specific integrase [Pinibacter soli]|uniref:Site-specific integrase n=1 Tax=Pinibacter soli TaxID=3044211 RepID=A0ABT6RBS7_9BACT|nr:site-specific integrase [Pinibacter soli]MDI3320014.1 site-specific integrase [Pinibacter soli]